jgi:chromosome partitioning protein
LIDTDPQGNTTTGVGIRKESLDGTLYDVLTGNRPLHSVVVPTQMDGLQLVPSDRNLIGATVELIDASRREYLLKDKIGEVVESYRYILIDCPPALDLLTLNALVAADSVLIPIQCEFFALEGVRIMDTIDRVGILSSTTCTLKASCSRCTTRGQISREWWQTICVTFSRAVFSTMIPRSVRLEAPAMASQSFCTTHSAGAESYIKLAKEILERDHKVRPISRNTR